MDVNDIKLFAINTATLAISFSAVEDALKLVLLVVSIVYTVQRSYELYKKRKED
jgi:hypothetical protein